MKDSKIALLIFGTLPPPVGGVTVFLERFSRALEVVDSVSYDFYSMRSWIKVFRKRYDVAHGNASRPIKRLALVVLGKLLARRVFFTIHGSQFDFSNLFNKIALKGVDGVFCLNKKVEQELRSRSVRCLVHTTVFQENITEFNGVASCVSTTPTVLFYANNCEKSGGEEIYGATFFYRVMFQAIKKRMINIVVIDLSGDYRELFSQLPNLEYFSTPQDFTALLKKSDVYLRPTSTDGASVALFEAGLLGVPCLASDCVDRPDFVMTYLHNDEQDCLAQLEGLLSNRMERSEITLSSVKDLLEFIQDS